jgi:hypothetical protein
MRVLGSLTKRGMLLGFIVSVATGAPAQTVQVKVASTAKEIFDNLPLFVARDTRIFEKHGLDVELRLPGRSLRSFLHGPPPPTACISSCRRNRRSRPQRSSHFSGGGEVVRAVSSGSMRRAQALC